MDTAAGARESGIRQSEVPGQFIAMSGVAVAM